MTGFGILNFIAMALELCVPSYALRLVRRFGAAQVGSFVIIAFLCLALLHLVNPLKPVGSNVTLSVVYGAASLLLLIGMGHTETICRERQQAQVDEERLRGRLDTEARERAENLLQIKQEMAQEIVRLQQQVETLSSSERQYRLLFTQHPHPMWMFDLRSGRILAGNQAALAQYGFSQQEFTALFAKDLLSREATESFLADATRPCSSLERRGIWRHRKKDRTTLDVEVMAMDLRFGECPARLMFVEDIYPRQARETQLCDQQRMHILHQVAQGVAHHFGGILSAVDGQVEALRSSLEAFGQTEQLEQVLAETRRGGALLRQLLAAGGCGSIQSEALDLNAFVLKHEPLLRRLVGDRVALQVQLVDGLSPILADGRVLEQILVTLVLNSRQALPQGGAIEISTQAAWGDASQPLPNSVPGHYVRLGVRDNGCGMAAEVQRRLFEPFFTTRDHDQAMGLGLATVYGALKQLGGWVEFVSQPHAGSEFSVFLPVAKVAAHSTAAEQPLAPAASRETILLVEPSDRVRDLARHILQRSGYRVVEIDSVTTAILLMESLATQAHLLLTDLSFPTGESGRDMADQFLQMNPKLQVVYATAPAGSEEGPVSLPQDVRLLLKPYTPDQLLKTVGSCFGRA